MSTAARGRCENLEGTSVPAPGLSVGKPQTGLPGGQRREAGAEPELGASPRWRHRLRGGRARTCCTRQRSIGQPSRKPPRRSKGRLAFGTRIADRFLQRASLHACREKLGMGKLMKSSTPSLACHLPRGRAPGPLGCGSDASACGIETTVAQHLKRNLLAVCADNHTGNNPCQCEK